MGEGDGGNEEVINKDDEEEKEDEREEEEENTLVSPSFLRFLRRVFRRLFIAVVNMQAEEEEEEEDDEEEEEDDEEEEEDGCFVGFLDKLINVLLLAYFPILLTLLAALLYDRLGVREQTRQPEKYDFAMCVAGEGAVVCYNDFPSYLRAFEK